MIRGFTGLRRWRDPVARVLGVPAGFVASHACRFSSRKLALALVYHSIADHDGEPAFELVPPHGVSSFRRHMRLARACFEIVPASELVPAMRRRRRGGRFPLAVTFDDDLSSHRVAVDILLELRLTATFFLTGATLDHPHSFWWQLLQACYDRGVSAPARGITDADGTDIHTVALRIQGMPRGERHRVSARLRELLGGSEPELGLQAEDVRALAAAKLEIGFHTRHHDYLPALSDEALEVAVSDGRHRLESVAGATIRTIAYPHGGADGRVADAARRAGFRFGFVGEPSAIAPGDDPLLLARIEPPRAGAGRFGMRIARHLVDGIRS
jgi:peptidoglycan/xylan/chitin deacetylase (PgdA/CDA1 family)